MTTVDKREAMRRAARRFWDALSRHDRFELGDVLVLEGAPDWREWLHEKPAPGFWNAVDELRMNWEIMDGRGGKARRRGGKGRHMQMIIKWGQYEPGYWYGAADKKMVANIQLKKVGEHAGKYYAQYRVLGGHGVEPVWYHLGYYATLADAKRKVSSKTREASTPIGYRPPGGKRRGGKIRHSGASALIKAASKLKDAWRR